MYKSRRYIWITSVVGLVTAVVLLLVFRHVAFQRLINHETTSNVTLTQIFSNTVWTKYSSFVRRASQIPKDELPDHYAIRQLGDDLHELLAQSRVSKVKIHDLNGLTVFSIDPEQIGEDESRNSAFQRAKNGEPVSKITFHDRLKTFQGMVFDRHLVSSYIPVRASQVLPVESVFEVYSDVTGLTRDLKRLQWKIVGWVVGSLSLLYTIIFVFVRRADRTIQRQEKERLANEAKIHYQAYYDALTDLPNRTSFGERLREAIKRAQRAERMLAVLYIDVDDFKLVNDNFGHTDGDQVLKLVAKRLRTCIRENDFLFHMGDDEFTVIIEELEFLGSPGGLAARIIDAMAEPMAVNDHNLIVTVSIGVAVYPKDDITVEKLVKNADTAMYLAKEAGRNQYQYFSPLMKEQVSERLAFESGLKHALRNNEFLLYYQPRVATGSDDIIAVEALLRWEHPQWGLVRPKVFITLLERMGQINAVGEWVLRNACQQVKMWHEAGLTGLRISVNISPRQFRTGALVDTVSDALSRSKLDPAYLELELTEGVLVENAEEAVDIMSQLKQLGVLLCIDDFGTGYSSLNHVKMLPIDFLKIDRTFVMNLNDDEKNAAIVKTIAALAHSLKIKLVAEGVEQPQQLEFLKTLNCHEAQGCLFSPSVPPQDIPVIVSNQRMRRAV